MTSKHKGWGKKKAKETPKDSEKLPPPKTFETEVDRFTRAHRKTMYPLIFNYSIAKETIGIMRDIGEELQPEFPEMVGLGIYGSRARSYTFNVDDDWDCIIYHTSDSDEKIKEMRNAFRKALRKRHQYPCEAGTDTVNLNLIEKDPSSRRDSDIYFLFHGIPIYQTEDVIRARKKYLEKAVENPEVRKEWESVWQRLTADLGFSKKAAFSLFSKTTPQPQMESEYHGDMVRELSLTDKARVEEQVKRIRDSISDKTKTIGFRKDLAEELVRINEWLGVREQRRLKRSTKEKQ